MRNWIMGVVGAGMLAIGGAAAAQSYVNDFSTSAAPGTLVGVASVTNGYLRLTPATAGVNGALVIPSMGTVESFSASFDLYFSGSSPADGIAFSLGVLPDTNNTDVFDEKGADQGLAVSFDWYEEFPTVAVVNIRLNNVTIQRVFNVVDRVGDANVFRRATVSMDSLGNLTVTYAGRVVVVGFATGFVPNSNYRFGFSSRTGGLVAEQRIDNVTINTVLRPCLGDADRSGIVDFNDIATVLSNYGCR